MVLQSRCAFGQHLKNPTAYILIIGVSFFGCIAKPGRIPHRPPSYPRIIAAVGPYNIPLTQAFVLSPYGPRGRKFHSGIDLRGAWKGGDPVYASRGGRVVKAARQRGYGKMILLQHADGTFTR